MTEHADIEALNDITSLTELYQKELKESIELSKQMDIKNERFALIRNKITILRHSNDDKSEEKEDVSPVEEEKPKKLKKVPVKKETAKSKKLAEVKEVEKEDEKEEPSLEEIKEENDNKSKTVAPVIKKEEPVAPEPKKTGPKGRKKKE
jgi:hypothetical protein